MIKSLLREHGYEYVGDSTYQLFEEDLVVEVTKIGSRYYVREEFVGRGDWTVNRHICNSETELQTVMEEIWGD